MTSREFLRAILQLFGLGDLEQRLFDLEFGFSRKRARLRLRLIAALLPAAVWTMFIVYTAAALAWAMRRQPSDDVRHQEAVSDVRLTARTPASVAVP
jgi:hypothetical protein